MKRFYILFITLLLFFSVLFAQQNRLQVSVNAMPGSQADWEMTLDWQSGIEQTGGILFQLPAGIQLVPLSVKLGDSELWLKKGNRLPQQDSVAVWDVTADGLILLFRPGLVKRGDDVIIRCHAGFNAALPEGSAIQLKEVTVQNGSLKPVEQSVASASIPPIPQKQEN